MPSAAHILIGKEGEDRAIGLLRRMNFAVLDRNVRIGRHDEIDIVAWDPVDRVLVFVEVKTRSSESVNYHPELNITRTKKRRMLRAARAWVDAHTWDGGYRMDVLCIAGGKLVEHFVDVTVTG